VLTFCLECSWWDYGVAKIEKNSEVFDTPFCLSYRPPASCDGVLKQDADPLSGSQDPGKGHLSFMSEDFAHRSNMTKHVRQAHENAPKKCVCGICGKAFHDNWGLKNHKSNVHVEWKGYDCHYCTPTSSSTSSHHKKHMRSEHGHGVQG